MNIKNNLPKVLIIIGVFFLFVILVINYLFFNKETAIKSRAEGESAALEFNPTNITASTGTFTVTLKVNPTGGFYIRGYDIIVTYDSTKLQATNVEYNLGSGESGIGTIGTGTIRIFGEIQSTTGTLLNETKNVATITFTSLSGQASTVQTTSAVFKMINADATLADINATSGVLNINSGGNSVTATPTPTGIPDSSVPNCIFNYPLGNSTTVKDSVISDTGESGLTRSKAVVTCTTYDSNGIGGIRQWWSGPGQSGVENTNWWISPTGNWDINNPTVVAYMTFPMRFVPGEYRAHYRIKDTLGNASQEFISSPITLLADQPTNTKLNFKLKFQGIHGNVITQFVTQPVKITLVPKTGMNTTIEGVEFRILPTETKGIWTGSTEINLTQDLTNYTIYVKGPKHLQKKICDMVPQETYEGSYRCSSGNITINRGVNNYDFSKIILLVGDLPEQDGFVNSYDLSLVRNNLGSTDTDILKLADLNLDGVVDTQDHSLIISALSYRTDEE